MNGKCVWVVVFRFRDCNRIMDKVYEEEFPHKTDAQEYADQLERGGNKVLNIKPEEAYDEDARTGYAKR